MRDYDTATIHIDKNAHHGIINITYTQHSDIMEITITEKTHPYYIIESHKIHQPSPHHLHQYLKNIGINQTYRIHFSLKHASLIHKTQIHIHSNTPDTVNINYNDIRNVCSIYDKYPRYLRRFNQQDIIIDSTTTFKQIIAQNAIIYHQYYPFLQHDPQTQYTYATVVRKYHLNPRVYIRIIARPHPNTFNHIRIDLEIYIDQHRRNTIKYTIHDIDNPNIRAHRRRTQRRHQHFQRIHGLLQRTKANLTRIPHNIMSQHAIIELHHLLQQSLRHNKNAIIHDTEHCYQAILDHYPPISRTPN